MCWMVRTLGHTLKSIRLDSWPSRDMLGRQPINVSPSLSTPPPLKIHGGRGGFSWGRWENVYSLQITLFVLEKLNFQPASHDFLAEVRVIPKPCSPFTVQLKCCMKPPPLPPGRINTVLFWAMSLGFWLPVPLSMCPGCKLSCPSPAHRKHWHSCWKTRMGSPHPWGHRFAFPLPFIVRIRFQQLFSWFLTDQLLVGGSFLGLSTGYKCDCWKVISPKWFFFSWMLSVADWDPRVEKSRGQ